MEWMVGRGCLGHLWKWVWAIISIIFLHLIQQNYFLFFRNLIKAEFFYFLVPFLMASKYAAYPLFVFAMMLFTYLSYGFL